MAKPGPKAKSNVIKLNTGTDQPCRLRESLFESEEGEPVRPQWLKGRARKIWVEKVERYSVRGQNVKGFEDALAQYCALEAELINLYKKGITPPMAMVNAYRIWASEFFDTPASNLSKLGGKRKDNPFSEHGI